MIWVAKLFVAWLFAMAATLALGGTLLNSRIAPVRSWDGILGIGLALGLPMLVFAVLIALPLSFLVARNMPPLGAALLTSVLIGGAAWLVSATLPSGWKGAQQALIFFGIVLGVGLGLLSLFFPPSPGSA